jgi:hypothetical protein
MTPKWEKNRLAKACPCFDRLSRVGNVRWAAPVLEEIEPEDKNRHEVLGARVALYMGGQEVEHGTHITPLPADATPLAVNAGY